MALSPISRRDCVCTISNNNFFFYYSFYGVALTASLPLRNVSRAMQGNDAQSFLPNSIRAEDSAPTLKRNLFPPHFLYHKQEHAFWYNSLICFVSQKMLRSRWLLIIHLTVDNHFTIIDDLKRMHSF